jgi:hypothetical protein
MYTTIMATVTTALTYWGYKHTSQDTCIYRIYEHLLGSPVWLCDLCDLLLFGLDDCSQILFPDVHIYIFRLFLSAKMRPQEANFIQFWYAYKAFTSIKIQCLLWGHVIYHIHMTWFPPYFPISVLRTQTPSFPPSPESLHLLAKQRDHLTPHPYTHLLRTHLRQLRLPRIITWSHRQPLVRPNSNPIIPVHTLLRPPSSVTMQPPSIPP